MGPLNTPATLFCWKSSDSSSLSIGLSWCGEGILEKPVCREFRELPFTHLVAHSEICVKSFKSVRPCAGLCRVSRHEGAWLLAFPSSLLSCFDPVLCFFIRRVSLLVNAAPAGLFRLGFGSGWSGWLKLWGHSGGIPGREAVLTSPPFINIFSVLSAHTYFQSLQKPFGCNKTKHQGSDRPGSGSYAGKLPDQDLNPYLSICVWVPLTPPCSFKT